MAVEGDAAVERWEMVKLTVMEVDDDEPRTKVTRDATTAFLRCDKTRGGICALQASEGHPICTLNCE